MHQRTDTHVPNGPFFTDLVTGVTMNPREFPVGGGLITIPARMVAAANRDSLRNAARDIS